MGENFTVFGRTNINTSQNITWKAPEGGGGPSYQNM
ncbi:4Fe-4S dicluster domain-containing protein [Vibrio alginolyticus]|nr:4Fe-4S dicluster domain-containing protein [Vibrio parahaemolyticus]MBS9940163.1 4Fe-4S dicluster domain-containing protein [Vibrio alginolyticus]MBT0000139.1 4Fe-4S dicluster domain-containing protein [Vibrio alginolyticus]HCZ9540929.1 4Fe-4S dicluster domain-containing protein [Vibrio alginolyticus]HDU8589109.1 4Fe-4S dicluster domain-containing protein [Vibrio alginolyticus]